MLKKTINYYALIYTNNVYKTYLFSYVRYFSVILLTKTGNVCFFVFVFTVLPIFLLLKINVKL